MAFDRTEIPYELDSFYMPLVSANEVREAGIDLHPIIDTGRCFDLHRIRTFCAELAVHDRFDLPRHDEVKAKGLGLGFGEIEAQLYYSAVCTYRPELIIEIGSGVSTWYAREAASLTGSRILCIEPYPAEAFPQWCAKSDITLWKMPLQQAIERVSNTEKHWRLPDRTLLFIDSTHVAKITSELHLIFTELLPRMARGALIHFHDIFLPWPCVRSSHLLFGMTVNWYESTMLGVFLQASEQYDVVLPQYWLPHVAPEILEHACRLFAETHWEGSSFWLRKR